MSFFPIKDSSGTTQLVVHRHRDSATAHLAALSDVPVESTVLIEGQVRVRPEKARRPVSFVLLCACCVLDHVLIIDTKENTGEIEVDVDNFILLNPANRDLPFYPSNEHSLVSTVVKFFIDHSEPSTLAGERRAEDPIPPS